MCQEMFAKLILEDINLYCKECEKQVCQKILTYIVRNVRKRCVRKCFIKLILEDNYKLIL